MDSSSYLPYGKHQILEDDIASVVEVLKHGQLTQGEIVPNFEQMICQSVGAAYSVATNSATSALHLACLSLGISKGDCVWTSPITFVASANCARYCGADVDFVDIEYETGLISIDALRLKIQDALKTNNLPKALIVVHLAGRSCDMEQIYSIVSPHNIQIIEDASHALGSSYQDEQVGSCKYSDATVFSFHPVKMITTAEGGILTTNSLSVFESASLLRSHGITKDPTRFKNDCSGLWHYEQQALGFNYRLSDMQAALGLSQLSRLPEIVRERNRLYQAYSQRLVKSPYYLVESAADGNISSLHLAIVQLPEICAIQHERLFAKMREMKIGVQLHYSPVHLQPYYKDLGFSERDFPSALKYARTSLSIPLFVGLTEKQQDRVVRCLHQAYEEIDI